MRKLRHIASMIAVGAAALLAATSLATAGDAEQSPGKTARAAASKATKGAKSTAATQTAKRSALALAAQPSAEQKQHRLVLQVNTNDAAAMNLALNNAMNVTEYYKEAGEKVEIEVIAFGPGLHMLRDDTSPVKARIETMALSAPEVSFKACGNTQTNMSKAESKEIKLIPQAQVVPSGVVRVMQREEEGWSYVKP
jgi:intracellular sulfur oxidation DsrE/DsrF family protein